MSSPNNYVIKLDIDNDRSAFSINKIKNSFVQTRDIAFMKLFFSMQASTSAEEAVDSWNLN